MKKKVAKCLGVLVFITIVIFAIYNIYNSIVCGKQDIKINTSSKAYINNDLYVSIIAQKNGVDQDTKIKLKLLNYKKKAVKNVNIKYEENNAIISIPEIEAGNYFIQAKVSSKAGKDIIQKEIYISDENTANVTITLDKGIYKPGDTVNYRALITKKENDEPVVNDINISIYDGNDNKVYDNNIKSSDYGIISGSFSLANEVNSGLYKLIVKTQNNETTKQFKVNPYVVPKYEIKINYDKGSYLVGEKAKINLNAKYFFGQPVQDANYTIYIDNKEYSTLKADSQGNATIDYEIKEAKTYNIKVEAVDSSNYFIEETSNFTAGTDIFEIQVLPEYGTLVSGKKNDVYVFTNKADGTPLKTYINISSDNYNKQIATDENGIGKFSIDISHIYDNGDYYYNSKNKKQISVIAQDEAGNKVSKNISLNIEKRNLLLSTNKVKYEQGEDIRINISSITENAKNIYFFKDDKLVKMLSTDLEETTINLDDKYGLIDVYVTEKSGTSSKYNYNAYNTNTYKRTIFIKPTKKLNININANKEEYKPGEDINISFDTVDENNVGVDAALLVSMLDNSILSLANNDISIDNIKIALQNIKLSNDLDFATLYSCIIDDSSEQAIMGLLLKQDNKNINISETTINNYEQKDKAQLMSIITITIIIVIAIIALSLKFKKFRVAMKHVVNFLIFDFILGSTAICIIDEFFYNMEYGWWTFIITIIIGFTTYILYIYKLKERTFRTSISIIITGLLYILFEVLIDLLEVPMFMIVLICSILLLILVILEKINERKKYKYMNKINIEIVYILRFIGALIISLIIGSIVQKLLIIDNIMMPVILICLYFFNCLFNKLGKVELEGEINKNKKSLSYYILLILAIIGIMAVGHIAIDSYESQKFSSKSPVIDDVENRSINEGTIIPAPMYGSSVGDTSKSKQKTSILDEVTDMFSISQNEKVEQQTNNINKEESTTETITDDNIRNVFLESMCFIPELITTKGNANVDLKLSDNITTWTIQTIGNTKDGRIGYGILNNVKVFKDFFVDFELPKNMVETDNVSIPITIFNYTDNEINTTLKIKEDDWFILHNNNVNVSIAAKSSNMVYIPISILKRGNNKFRVEASGNTVTDIVEKECIVTPKGYKVEKVVSTGILDKDISEDILVLDNIVENTAKAKVKIYSSTMSQAIEGMENIFKMPTGCFEQISSSLYPNILALKYLEDNGIVNNEIKEKAISYISSGYQKLLTYEVMGESGGYSLYGHSPAETVLTAYGLMEITDLSKVYNVDNNVINKMTEFLYKKQNVNGTFTITGSHIGGANSRDNIALNAYITWALSESNPNDQRLNRSIDYLKGKLDNIDDNYTLALLANIMANVKDKELNNVLKRLVNNINLEGNSAYITSNIVDYYGTRSNVQTIQTVALTSMALSKSSYKLDTNKLLINYLISKKDARGTWYSTQATILALKALNEKNEKNKLDNQTITVKVNSEEQKIEIKDNPIELYELVFDNLNKENKLNIDIKKGNAYYEVIEEYYVPYEKVDKSKDNIEVVVDCNNSLKVNEILKSNIKVINRSGNNISNGMVTISIPQGFSVIEESLMLLENKGIIEKYETSYTEINIYLRNFEANQITNLELAFRANYPVKITGLAVRAYDYYNPEIEGKAMPIEINVKD